MDQNIITAKDNYKELDLWIERNGCKNILLVCDGSIAFMDGFNKYLEEIAEKGTGLTDFRDFCPNPLYESVVKGVELFRAEKCDGIIAVGGGSAMDVAKCIKLYASLPGTGEEGAWLRAEIEPNTIPFLAMPTTAGTGSEATRYAVIYYNDAKQSVKATALFPKRC